MLINEVKIIFAIQSLSKEEKDKYIASFDKCNIANYLAGRDYIWWTQDLLPDFSIIEQKITFLDCKKLYEILKAPTS